MKRFLIAEDYAIIRFAIRSMLQKEFPAAFVEEVDDAESLLQKVSREDWDVVITDISMPGRSGLDVMTELRKVKPGLPVLVLSQHSTAIYGVRVIKAGGAGYIKKDTALLEIIKAIETVLQGKKYITPEVAEQLALSYSGQPTNNPHHGLSDREFEIFMLIVSGITPGAIASKLLLGVTTISTYRARILQKLHLKTNSDLMEYARAHGLE